MFERFGDLSRRVVVLSQEQSRALGHDVISAEHLLLALTTLTEDPLRGALDEAGVQHAALRDAVARALPSTTSGAPSGHIPFTPAAKQALEASLRHALGRKDTTILPAHLLLGTADQAVDGSTLATVLSDLGVSTTRLVDAATRVLDEQHQSARGDDPTTRRTPGLLAAERAAAALAGDAPIGTHHLLAAFLAADDSAAARILRDGGFDPASLSDPPEHWGVAGTTDDTPRGRAQRSVRVTVGDDELHLTISDPALVSFVQRITSSSAREPDPEGDPETAGGSGDDSIRRLIADALAPLFRLSEAEPEPRETRSTRARTGEPGWEARLRARVSKLGVDDATIDEIVTRALDAIGRRLPTRPGTADPAAAPSDASHGEEDASARANDDEDSPPAPAG